MPKYKFVIALILCNLFFVSAQSADPVVLSYQRNFIRASISTKLELVNDASRITAVNMTPLYADALVFVKNAYPLLGPDAQLMELGSAAASRSAANNDVSVLPVLREVFAGINDTGIRISSLNTFSVLAKNRKDDIAFLNAWFREGSADVKTLAFCAQVLGKLGDASSFDALFRAATGNLDSGVVQAAAAALNAIEDGYTENILARIGQKGIQESYAAFSFAMKKEGLPAADRGRIAEAAFTYASESQSGSEGDSGRIRALIRESLVSLTALKWSQASPAVVKYFYLTQGDYKKDRANVDTLIPVVACMGTMGTSEAAQALSIFLGLLNSDTEQKKNYNEQLMLAVIQALGDLGDKSAFDYLLYVGYLDYPETVKKASRDALARLEW